jgi:Protein of unknown function (DUF2946)
MRWVRTKRRWGTWLALAAMALQLALSFGHLHLDGIAPERTVAVSDAASSGQQPSPSQHHDSDGDDYCAICAVMHLASTSFLPDAPQLPMPIVSQTIEHSSRVFFVFVAPRRTAFQSRAPPLA